MSAAAAAGLCLYVARQEKERKLTETASEDLDI
jgi:hypothetical protein